MPSASEHGNRRECRGETERQLLYQRGRKRAQFIEYNGMEWRVEARDRAGARQGQFRARVCTDKASSISIENLHVCTTLVPPLQCIRTLYTVSTALILFYYNSIVCLCSLFRALYLCLITDFLSLPTWTCLLFNYLV